MGDIIVNHPKAKIKVDITRQMESTDWRLDKPGKVLPTYPRSETFELGDIPNDDGKNDDEDVKPFIDEDGKVSDKIYSRDMQGTSQRRL